MTQHRLLGAYYSTSTQPNEIVLVGEHLGGEPRELVVSGQHHYERLVAELQRLGEALGWSSKDDPRDAPDLAEALGPDRPDGIAFRSTSHLDTEDARERTRHEARCAALRAAVHLVGPGRTGRDMLHVAELFEHWLMRPTAAHAGSSEAMADPTDPNYP